MPLRAMALLLSLIVHGLFGFALWPRHPTDELEALDFGAGRDIELMPQGIVMGEASNRGDDIENIATQDVVPVDKRQPSPEAALPTPDQSLPDVPTGDQRQSVQDAASVPEQKPPPQAPTVLPPERLHDVPDDAERKSTQDVSAVPEQVPSPQPPTTPSSQQLRDVAEGVENETPGESAPVEAQRPAIQHAAVAPKQVLADAAGEVTKIAEQERAVAPEAPFPDPLKEPSSGKPGDLPPLEQLKDSKVAQSATPSTPKPVVEQRPEVVEMEVRPAQVAMVTEESSGRELAGGDAHVVGLYLGRINERVQQFKVNPQSRLSGIVVLKYTVGTDGSLMAKEVTSSSGSRVLDDAALATLERAAPFPHIPVEVSVEPMVFTQSFRFIVR